MLNKKILVKSITSLSEARYCAGMFVDYISFDFNPESDFFVTKKQFDEIRGWLSGVKILGSLDTNNSDEITELIKENNLDGFLFSQDQYTLISLVEAELKVLQWNDLAFLPTHLDEDIILLLNSDKEIDNLPESNTILQGFSFDNVKFNSEKIAGFAFHASIEEQVGNNSYAELMEAFEYIEENY